MQIATPTLLYTAIGILVILVVLVIHLQIRVNRLLRGKETKDLEGTILNLSKESDSLHKWREEVEAYLKNVEERLKRSISGVSTVRFNPFKGSSGSNQSFASAFLNEKGNGIVISTLYSRDRVSIFAKPIKKNGSEYELTTEEKDAIAQTKQSE